MIGLLTVALGQVSLQAWFVDPLEKVFQDAQPVASQPVVEVARGEVATWQIVLLGEGEVAISVDRLDPDLPRPVVSRVAYVPIEHSAETPDPQILRMPPGDFPDPLVPCKSVTLKAGMAQPVWVEMRVPKDAKPGVYAGVVEFSSGDLKLEFPIELKVFQAELPEQRLLVTNWFDGRMRHGTNPPEIGSEAYWKQARAMARLMIEHGSNVPLISPIWHVEHKADGSMDWTQFDRWVEIFLSEGAQRIEGGHIGARISGWESQFGFWTPVVEGDSVQMRVLEPSDPRAQSFMARLLPELVRHVRGKGWLGLYMQHIADEPGAFNLETYRQLSSTLKKYAPELRVIEATHSKDLAGDIDIWVPQVDMLHRDYEYYVERQKAGDEIWFYTCLYPDGIYPNRFIEQHALKTRGLHWINAKYGATGYLHWGWNQYSGVDPWTKLNPPHPGVAGLPAGDAWIVYPLEDGTLVPSIRLKAMRDGIADYELLRALQEVDPSLAEELCKRVIADFNAVNIDIRAFREARRAMLTRLSG